MIVRIFQVVVHDGQVDRFARFFRETAIPLVRRQPGLISLTAGLPRPESPCTFAMVMVWRDVNSLKAFAGTDWRQPHIHPDEEGVVRERHLSHYTLAA